MKRHNSDSLNEHHTILVVDDEASVRMTIEEMLYPLNCQILHANNSHEAIEIIKTTHIDLIILDLLLPGRHGFYVCSEIREMERCKDIPILIITAVYTKIKYFHQAKEYGANSYITKPFKMGHLLNEVCKLLKIDSSKIKQLAASP